MDSASRKEAKGAKKEAKAQAKVAKKAGKRKLNKSDKKGILLILVLIVAVGVLAKVCSGLVPESGIVANINLNGGNVAMQEEPTVTTAKNENESVIVITLPSEEAQISTETPTTENTVTPEQTPSEQITSAQQDTTAQQTPPPTQNTAPTDAEILDIVTKAVNSLKSDTANFKGSQVQSVNIWMTDCSVPALTGTVNKILESFINEDVYDFEFVGGKAMDPEEGREVTGAEVFPPSGGPFRLALDGVASTSVSKNEKGTVYSVTLVPESGTLENPRPTHHNAASDILDLSTISIPMGKITKADFQYPGAIITVTIDESGKIVEYHERLDVKGAGEAKLAGMTGTADLEGYIDEKWVIEWK